MEEERKFVCKYCFKRFLSGKSLGGHIRIHITKKTSYNNNNADSDVIMKKKRDLLWFEEASGNSIYGLRENPKKKMRFVHSESTSEEEQNEKKHYCKECGKDFSSLKALCGHMASHTSEKKKNKRKLVLESESDNENETPRRSKRLTPLVEQEQEEVAMCLMMLSRHSTTKRCRSASVSSDHNNSINLEKVKKLSSSDVCDIKVGTSYNSDSRFLRYWPETNEEFKVGERDKLFFDNYNVESKKMMDRSNHSLTVFEKLMIEDLDHDGRRDGTRRKIDDDSLAHNLFGVSSNKRENGFSNDEVYYDSTAESDEKSSESDSFSDLNGKKKKGKKNLKSNKEIKEHECPICNRIFRSGQALGGHKRSHFVIGGEKSKISLCASSSAAVPCLFDLNLPAPVDE